jgi:hypothetical protein
MSHFEYISVAASLIYSLILAKLLGSLPAALQPGKRYWVHSLWIASPGGGSGLTGKSIGTRLPL